MTIMVLLLYFAVIVHMCHALRHVLHKCIAEKAEEEKGHPTVSYFKIKDALYFFASNFRTAEVKKNNAKYVLTYP